MAPMNTRKLHMVTVQKSLWLIFKLYCYFVHDVLKKIGLDSNMLQGNCRCWKIATREGTKRS